MTNNITSLPRRTTQHTAIKSLCRQQHNFLEAKTRAPSSTDRNDIQRLRGETFAIV
ncbi:hypothetical protein J6590_025159 [Homalodisca vitripennis]|nr:hypothetical protein J6590_025159 [Homalodisca vitripennis]